MSDQTLSREGTPRSAPASRSLHRFALILSAATFVLVYIGGLVTSTGSGLAVPDWPLANGQFFPPMVGGVLFEHGHRLAAATVGLLVVALFLWVLARRSGGSVTTLAGAALGTVILQGMLGGLTVLLQLPPAVSILHACLAQAFLCLTVAIAVVTGPGWAAMTPGRNEMEPLSLRTLAFLTTVTVYAQLILGAVVRHTKAGLAIPDFPLAFGGIVPPLDDPGVRIHFTHRLGALVVAILALWTATRILRAHGEELRLRRPALLLLALVALQISLGGLAVLTKKAVVPTTSHVLVGAMVLATSFLILLRSYRLIPSPGSVGVRRGAARQVPA